LGLLLRGSIVYKLKKALYLTNHRGHSLENFPRQYWSLVSNNVRHIILYFTYHTSTCYILLVVYVDDIVITRDDSGGIVRLKQFL
jgi:hypothetical protein